MTSLRPTGECMAEGVPEHRTSGLAAQSTPNRNCSTVGSSFPSHTIYGEEEKVGKKMGAIWNLLSMKTSRQAGRQQPTRPTAMPEDGGSCHQAKHHQVISLPPSSIDVCFPQTVFPLSPRWPMDQNSTAQLSNFFKSIFRLFGRKDDKKYFAIPNRSTITELFSLWRHVL